MAAAMGDRYIPISAGFVGVDADNKPHAWGDSFSLKLASDPSKDDLLLSFTLRGLFE
jgi:hypothetical protein